MPIEAAVGFVTEQAVGIVVGAAAVALAPVITPKLRTVAGSVQQATMSVVDTAKDAGFVLMSKTSTAGERVAGAMPAAAVAVTQPIADAGKSAYHATLTGAHWYAEQWADVAAEAQEWVLPSSNLPVAEVMVGMPAAKVVSDLPGRARVHVGQIRGDSRLAKVVAEGLSSRLGDSKVTASAATGNVLIRYDREKYRSVSELLGRFAER